jgi:formamidopyrimidine-DNA glycosylase
MPEGPEVWFLGRVLRNVLEPVGRSVVLHGKHLVLDGTVHHHFGLSGGLRMDVTTATDAGIVEITLRHHHGKGPVSGSAKPVTAAEVAALCAEGLDWMTAPRDAIADVISAAAFRRKALGAWMLDQHAIAGVGVAWASEIAAAARLDVARPMCAQNLIKLADAYISVREKAVALYTALLPPPFDTEAAKTAVNNWYRNLYAARAPSLTVYSVGTPVLISGRTFWKL